MLRSPFFDRVMIGTGAALVFGSLVYYSYHPFARCAMTFLLALLVSGALVEYYALAEKKGFRAARCWGVFASFAYILFSAYITDPGQQMLLIFALLLGVTIIAFITSALAAHTPIATTAITLFPQVYLTLPLGCAVLIARVDPYWLGYAVVVTKMTDVGAYLIGKGIGKIPLCPTVSPKKTFEGAIGGGGMCDHHKSCRFYALSRSFLDCFGAPRTHHRNCSRVWRPG